ncbi:MAG: hypothetical protein M3410_08825 [Acidobacteriota bacterium]|nr:hypothetical protein [Acidobacteriota bacterium]
MLAVRHRSLLNVRPKWPALDNHLAIAARPLSADYERVWRWSLLFGEDDELTSTNPAKRRIPVSVDVTHKQKHGEREGQQSDFKHELADSNNQKPGGFLGTSANYVANINRAATSRRITSPFSRARFIWRRCFFD